MTTYGGQDFWREHMPRWPAVPLRKVARLGTGHTPSRSEPGYWVDCTIPWVTTADLTARTDGGLQPLMETSQHISELGVANSAAVIHPTDTVMLSRTASIGHSVRIGRPMATTQAFVTWTCGPRIDPRYLLLVMNAMKPEFDRLAYGSTHLTIYFPDIEQLKVSLPPLGVQRAIADYLDTETARIDALVAKKQRMIELVSERVAARIAEGIRLADGPTAHLGHVARVFSGTGFPHEFQGRDDGEFPFYKVGDLSGSSDGRVISQAPNRIDRATAAQLGCRLAPPGSVLFPKVGAALLGNQRRITSVTAALDNNLMAVFSSELDSRYLRYVLTQVDMGQLANPGPVPSINESVVSSLSIRVPPLEDQRRLADELDRCMTHGLTIGQHLNKQVELLRERRAALITATVTGELEIPKVAA
jgi:type I restriction enzyme S subunit